VDRLDVDRLDLELDLDRLHDLARPDPDEHLVEDCVPPQRQQLRQQQRQPLVQQLHHPRHFDHYLPRGLHAERRELHV